MYKKSVREKLNHELSMTSCHFGNSIDNKMTMKRSPRNIPPHITGSIDRTSHAATDAEGAMHLEARKESALVWISPERMIPTARRRYLK